MTVVAAASSSRSDGDRIDDAATTENGGLYIGIDLGTSGARISVIAHRNEDDDDDDDVVSTSRRSFSEVFAHAIRWGSSSTDSAVVSYGAFDDPEAWTKSVADLIHLAARSVTALRHDLRAIAISGTSASCCLVQVVDNDNTATTTSPDATTRTIRPTRTPHPARMYNYTVTDSIALQLVARWAPPRHTAASATSSLAKLVAWHLQQPLSRTERLCHQADYVMAHLLDRDETTSTGIPSDWHNCLKLGYDVQNLAWPTWLVQGLTELGLDAANVLPHPVQSPGTPLGRVSAAWAEQLGIPPSTVIVAGTTDSNAAFVAATQGVATPGTAVTSLGSTLAIKQVSTTYIEDAERGIYSHRFPSALLSTAPTDDDDDDDDRAVWLVGGASNVGCAIFRALGFDDAELADLSAQIDPAVDSPYQYYPLLRPGERFPVADPTKDPVVTPVPAVRSEYLHGLLQGIADVERDGFVALGGLGANPPFPHQVWTCGGGSRNAVWNLLRQRRLRDAFCSAVSGKDDSAVSSTVVVQQANNVEASYGAAILAAATFAR
jgi:D-ribulokinase